MSEPTIRYSNLTLYKDCKILPFKNFILGSNISNHLSTLTSISITNFQWLRNTLDLVIKINKTEEFTAMLLANNYNYLKVDQDSKIYYYYVIRKTQLAQSTIQLELRMDVLNTFQWDTDFTPTNKTKVLREHKDRYEKAYSRQELWPSDPRSIVSEAELYSFDVNFISQTGKPDTTEIEFSSYDSNADNWDSAAIELFNEISEWKFVYFLYVNGEQVPYDIEKSVSIHIETPVLGGPVIFTGKIVLHGHISVDQVLIDPYGYGVILSALRKKIDLYSEGIHGNLYKRELGELNPPERTNWYLIYKNNAEATPENPEPLNCFLAPESSVEVKYESENVVDYNSVPSGKMIIFATQGLQYEKAITISFDGNSLTTNGYTAGLELQYVGVAIGRNTDPTKLDVYYVLWKRGEILGVPYYTYEVLGLWQAVNSVDVLSEQSPIKYYLGNSIPSNIGEVLINRTQTLTRSSYSVSLKAYADLDKTDVLLNKIINIPYLPQDYKFSSNKLLFSDDWTYSAATGFMKLKNLDVKFSSKIQTSIPSPITTKLANLVYADVVGTENLRNANLEPKLLHSDFYNIKFIYDSFTFVFQLEKMNIEEYQALNIENFEFTFVMTTTINSKFLFKFDFYKLLYSTEDFDNILPVARNNEAVIYNSPYLNYLRVAYNYDLKAKERTLTLAGVGGAFSVVSQLAGIGVGMKSSEAAVRNRALASGSTGVISTIMNTINTFISAEEDFAKNLDLLKTQSVSVAGSDDLDLMKAYCNNQAKLCEYEVSPRLKQALFDLFHYTGYISGEMKKPNVNTRYWFNFLACELVIDSNYANIPEICLDELKRLYAEGVTFLHYHTKFDFEQKWENWENSILNS